MNRSDLLTNLNKMGNTGQREIFCTEWDKGDWGSDSLVLQEVINSCSSDSRKLSYEV